MKRKRKSAKSNPAKKSKVDELGQDDGSSKHSKVDHPVLACYYKHVYTLSGYLHNRLAKDPERYENALNRIFPSDQKNEEPSKPNVQDEFHTFLDSVLVGVTEHSDEKTKERRAQDLIAFSQYVPDSTVGCDTVPDARLQLEVCIQPF